MWVRAVLVVLLLSLAGSTARVIPTITEDFPFIWPHMPTVRLGADRVGESAFDEGPVRYAVGRWSVVEWLGKPVTTPVVLDLTGRTVTTLQEQRFEFLWWGGCSGFGGSYFVDAETIHFAPAIPSDRRECGTALDVVELGFPLLLERADRWSATRNTLAIWVTDAGGAVLQRIPEIEVGIGSTETVAPEVHLVDPTGFLVRLAEQATADQSHDPGTVAWVAWSAGSDEGTVDGFTWESDRFYTRNAWRPDRTLELDYQLTRITPDVNLRDEACVLAQLNSTTGPRTATLRRMPFPGVHLFVQEENSSGVASGHITEVVGVVIADCGGEAPLPEFGSASSITEAWQRVELAGTFSNPVVVAGPATYRGSDAGVVELRNVTPTSFELRFHEWDYADGHHLLGEDIDYLVLEAGTTMLPSGARIEAGTARVDGSFGDVVFTTDFEETPIVLTTFLR